MKRKDLQADKGQVVDLNKERIKRKIANEEAELRKDKEKLAFKEDTREAVNAERQLRKRGKSSDSTLRDVMMPYFERHNRQGIDMLPRNNRKSYLNLYLTERNSKQMTEIKYLVVAVNKLIYIDRREDVIKTIDLSVEDIANISIRKNGDDVLIIDENSTRYIIKNQKLIDDKVGNRYWKDAVLSGGKYKSISFTIDEENITVKVHNLYLLLKNGLAVMSTIIWSGASPYCPDHINGDTLDNRDCNLQIITQKDSAAKRGSKEEHLSFDTYDYSGGLKSVSDESERNRLGKSS